jgi:hypothetical protein
MKLEWTHIVPPPLVWVAEDGVRLADRLELVFRATLVRVVCAGLARHIQRGGRTDEGLSPVGLLNLEV